jgi:hypothetical protein
MFKNTNFQNKMNKKRHNMLMPLCPYAPLHLCTFFVKRTQFAGLWPETRNSKLEILNVLIQKKKIENEANVKIGNIT